MKHITKYQIFNESKTDDDIYLYNLLFLLLIACLPDYKDKPYYYFSWAYEDFVKNKNKIKHLIDTILNKKKMLASKGLSRLKSLPATLNFINYNSLFPKFNKYLTNIRVAKNEVAPTSSYLDAPLISLIRDGDFDQDKGVQKVLDNKKEKIIVDVRQGSSWWAEYPEYEYNPLSFEIAYDKLLQNYDAQNANFFSDELLQFAWQKIDELHLKTWKQISINYPGNFKDLERSKADYKPVDGKAEVNSNKILSDHFDVLTCNTDYFKKLVDLFVEDGDKLPDLMVLHCIYRGIDVKLPIKCVNTEILNIESISNSKIMNICKQKQPEIYQYIKNQREKDQQWKTDLTADMGDLGFD